MIRSLFRHSHRTAWAVVLAPLALAAGPPDPEPRGAVSDHVIVVSIDGLRPDAIAAFDAGTMKRLLREGSYTLEAQTILPSKTLPSHTSMLTGVTPEVHGVTWNTDETDEHGVVGVETVFDVARGAGFHTAAFFSKSKFHHLRRPGSLDYSQAPSGPSALMVTRTIPDAIQYMRHERPNLLFVHIGEPDYAGHSFGWMSGVYGAAVRRADAGLDRLIEAADDAYGAGEYTLIVTADHGGHGRDHGSDHPLDTTIPWIAWGEGVEAGGRLGAPVRTMDTAATALWLLGVDIPADWSGSPVASAYTPVSRYAASLLQPAPASAAAAPAIAGAAH